ncbi:hypothetical protein D0Z00_001495 [Geotrichum galactomycetum]|uniref:Uncharacterized protein n=1 Tax=Geotrichum galactomycetum TaxID=27317 RepID=A0ACB6V701_9ASCO|nr:hypothetical protein D0Z00_001495 [Geotrichum candidum]
METTVLYNAKVVDDGLEILPKTGGSSGSPATKLFSCFVKLPFCSPQPASLVKPKLIPFYHVLWVEAARDNLVIVNYVEETSKDVFTPFSAQLDFFSSLGGDDVQSLSFSTSDMINKEPAAMPDPIMATITAKPSELTLKQSEESLGRTNHLQPLVSATSTMAALPATGKQAEIINLILARAYTAPNGTTPIIRRKRLLVLINPHGGPGRARSIYKQCCEQFLELARCDVTVIETTHRFHALELARDTPYIYDKYDGIVCCSGDGIPHEVLNGFRARADGMGEACLRQLPICQLPCGSGNSMAVSVNGSSSATKAALAIIKGVAMPIDLMLMTQADEEVKNQENSAPVVKETLSFLSQSFGTIADADLGTEPLRWMGPTRFTLGALYFTLSKKRYPCDVYVKYRHQDRNAIKQHFDNHVQNTLENQQQFLDEKINLTSGLAPKFGTVLDPVPEDWEQLPEGENLSLLYAGKFPYVSSDVMMFPASLPSDGTIDLFVTHAHKMSAVQSLGMLLSLEDGTHANCDFVQYSKVEGYRLVPRKNAGHLSIDGESFPHTPFQVEILGAAGCLLVPPEVSKGKFVETGF